MPETLASPLANRVPRLVGLVGAATVEAWWEWPRAVYLWQIERDLELLTRHVGWSKVARAYRASLRNSTELWGVAHELRTAAKLAPVVDGLELRPRVGTGACDLAVRLAGRRVFLEVTTRDDVWPLRRGDVEDALMQARETVHREFRTTTPDRVVPTTRDVPASEDLREAIRREVRQLPPGELTAVVLGTPNSKSLEVEDALFGAGRLGGRGRRAGRDSRQREAALSARWPRRIGGWTGRERTSSSPNTPCRAASGVKCAFTRSKRWKRL